MSDQRPSTADTRGIVERTNKSLELGVVSFHANTVRDLLAALVQVQQEAQAEFMRAERAENQVFTTGLKLAGAEAQCKGCGDPIDEAAESALTALRAQVRLVAQKMREEKESSFPRHRHGRQLERWADRLAEVSRG